MSLKRIASKSIRSVMPAAWLAPFEKRWFRVRWSGDYPDWRRACGESAGYADPAIFDTIAAAAREVRDGRACYERDGVAFREPPGACPLGEWLGRWARVSEGRLSVLDFGGALGSSYYQFRPSLAGVVLNWQVVEQDPVVAIGRREFTSSELHFFPTLEEAMAQGRPSVLLLSSVLPYLEDPHGLLDRVVDLNIPRVFVDRTGIVEYRGDRLTVQHVPASIYRASYPCWFLNRERLLAHFAGRYDLRMEYESRESDDPEFVFRGFAFESSAP